MIWWLTSGDLFRWPRLTCLMDLEEKALWFSFPVKHGEKKKWAVAYHNLFFFIFPPFFYIPWLANLEPCHIFKYLSSCVRHAPWGGEWYCSQQLRPWRQSSNKIKTMHHANRAFRLARGIMSYFLVVVSYTICSPQLLVTKKIWVMPVYEEPHLCKSTFTCTTVLTLFLNLSSKLPQRTCDNFTSHLWQV